MYFPIADAVVGAHYLIGIGCAVGICGGFIGMGGGWILVPALYALGIPMNVAVGTSLAQMVGHAVVSTFRHWQFGNVSMKIGFTMIAAELIGIEIGAVIIEIMKDSATLNLDVILSGAYLVLLFVLAAFMYRDVRKRRKEKQRAEEDDEEARDVMEQKSSLAKWASSINLKPHIKCEISGISSLSVWVIFFSALVIGIIIGLLGVGGGVIRMPLMIYLYGCPTVVAVGTGLFTIIIAGGYGAFTHALKGNVDLPIALLLFIGSALGAYVGSCATKYAKGGQIRGVVALLAFVAGLSITAKTFLPMFTQVPKPVSTKISLVLVVGVTVLMSLLILYKLVLGVLEEKREMEDNQSEA